MQILSWERFVTEGDWERLQLCHKWVSQMSNFLLISCGFHRWRDTSETVGEVVWFLLLHVCDGRSDGRMDGRVNIELEFCAKNSQLKQSLFPCVNSGNSTALQYVKTNLDKWKILGKKTYFHGVAFGPSWQTSYLSKQVTWPQFWAPKIYAKKAEFAIKQVRDKIT